MLKGRVTAHNFEFSVLIILAQYVCLFNLEVGHSLLQLGRSISIFRFLEWLSRRVTRLTCLDDSLFATD